jgi:phosphate/phosphite/phosphonate ABC transporter binding protein
MRPGKKQFQYKQTNVSIFLRKIFTCIFISFFIIGNTQSDASEKVIIGILAKRGEQVTFKRWQPLAKYLDQQVPGYHFEILPLDFDHISNAVANHAADFFFINSGIFIELEMKYGVRPIATVRTLRGDKGVSLFSGLIITRADRTDIRSFKDLRGKNFAAVKKNSLGGWLMAKRELEGYGINTDHDFKNFIFAGTHDAVVYKVMQGVVDAGTVRSDTLEHMSRDHLLDIKKVKVMHGDKVHYNFGLGEKDFPFPHSTDIYPEWPMVKLASTPDELANKVAIALLNIKGDEQAAKQAGIKGWDIARNYQPVHDLYREFRLGPYREIKHLNLIDVWGKFWPIITSLLILLGTLCCCLVILMHLRSRLIKANHRITHMAMHDPLTLLPNRRFFRSLALRAFSQARREGWKVYLLLIDLDDFKVVNDTHGHEYGDELLRQVGNRIRIVLPVDEGVGIPRNKAVLPLHKQATSDGVLRAEDCVARHGGDEFICLLIHVQNLEDALSIAERIVQAIEKPFDIFNRQFFVGASIGVSVYPDDGDSLNELTKKADMAMYDAKRSGKGTYKTYDKSSG